MFVSDSNIHRPQCNSAPSLTVQATVPSAQAQCPQISGTTGVQTSHISSSLLPTYHKQFTVDGALLSRAYLWRPNSVPHLPVQSHERLASSDSSSQHTALSRSAFSPAAAVSCTTSGG
ncbi:unnamed protein product [Pleuronectes platessa]|uniref:Uncharacterized protein n=1 Tax=Pleuronectes platessa TaxID=8262 RepID=A0A9N7UZL0_PLEPL|nr:unnamed protein product [Pleuronectes platessa]